jgi:predicted nucleic acid-binding protein
MILYVDTSSLIKLYIEEAGSSDVQQLVSGATTVVTSSIAYVEARATLVRHRRAGALTSRTFDVAKELLEHDWSTFVAVGVTSELFRAAGDLAERHHLRALDAIHLASFAEILQRRTDDDVYFSSFDEKLNRAARRLK